MAEVDAVLFDLDGTLIDHPGAVRAALSAWLPELGAHADERMVRDWVAIEETHIRSWRAGEIGWAEQRRRRLADFLPLIGRPVGSGDELDAVFAGYLRQYEASWRCFDDVVEALDAVARRGLRAAILTNGVTAQQEAKLRSVGLLGRFERVLTAEDLGVAKPDPAAYRLACERLGLEPGSVLHVGDLWDLDVLGARAAGVRAVQIVREGAVSVADPDRIGDLRDLAAVLERLAPAQNSG